MVRAAVSGALALCAKNVIPSLFPFLVVSSLLTAMGFGDWLSAPLEGFMYLAVPIDPIITADLTGQGKTLAEVAAIQKAADAS